MKTKIIFLIFMIFLLSGCRSVMDKKDINKGFSRKKLPTPELEEVRNIPDIKDPFEIKIDKDIDTEIKTENNDEENIINEKDQNQINKNNNITNKLLAYLKEIESDKEKEDDQKFDKRIDTGLKEKEMKRIKQDIEDKDLDLTNIDGIKIKELELKKARVEEGKVIYISLASSDWVLKSSKPPLLDLVNRENSKKNTLFQLEAGTPGVVNMLFLRYEDSLNTMWRQTYKVTILPKTWVKIKGEVENEKDTSDKKESKGSREENYNKETANQLFFQKEYEEAKKRYLSIIRSGGDAPEVYYRLGMIEKENKNGNKAYGYFEKALKDKDNVFYLNSLKEMIKMLKEEKKYSQAVDVFFKYAFNEELDPKIAEELYMLLADVYFNMGDYRSAANEYRRYIEKFPVSDMLDKALFYLAYSTENFKIDPDFKEAYRLYKVLVDDYTESKYRPLSKKRILHLERHYLKIY